MTGTRKAWLAALIAAAGAAQAGWGPLLADGEVTVLDVLTFAAAVVTAAGIGGGVVYKVPNAGQLDIRGLTGDQTAHVEGVVDRERRIAEQSSGHKPA